MDNFIILNIQRCIMQNNIQDKNIKFRTNKMNELLDMVVMSNNSGNKLEILPINDRALIYTMWWCTSDHSNLSRYEFDRLLEMSRKLRNYLDE